MKETKPEKQALLGKGGSEGRVDIQVMAGQVRPTCHGLQNTAGKAGMTLRHAQAAACRHLGWASYPNYGQLVKILL